MLTQGGGGRGGGGGGGGWGGGGGGGAGGGGVQLQKLIQLQKRLGMNSLIKGLSTREVGRGHATRICL